MHNSKNKISLSTTRTKAIQCEVLSNHQASNSNSWKFITPHRLQKAIQEAKHDLGCLLLKSVGVNNSGTSACSTKITVRDAVSTLSNPSQDLIRNSVKAKPIIQKHNSHTLCFKDPPYSKVKRNIAPQPCVSDNSTSSTHTSGLQRQQLQYNEELTEDDLQWLGKNYSTRPSRRPVFNNMNSKIHLFNERSLLPMSSTVTPKNQNKIRETALDFINRVQMREQQLWKQLAEMSITSLPSVSSTRSSPTVENYELIVPNLQNEQDIVTEISSRRNCTEIFSTQHGHDMIMDAESLVSLLGEEWLKKLLREELEMSNVG